MSIITIIINNQLHNINIIKFKNNLKIAKDKEHV